MIEMIRTLTGLESLPMMAVVESRNNIIYQRFVSGWYTTADPTKYKADQIALPARLLDDGR